MTRLLTFIAALYLSACATLGQAPCTLEEDESPEAPLVSPHGSFAPSGFTYDRSVFTYVQTTQNLTASAPSASTDGLAMDNLNGYRIVVCPPSDQTITGGAIDHYEFSPVGQAWSSKTQTWTVPATAGNGKCAHSSHYLVLVNKGRVDARTAAITLSGAGSTVTVRIEATTK